MNMEKEAIRKLMDYEAMRAGVENLKSEIANLRDDLTRIRSAQKDGTPVRGGGSAYEDTVLSNIALREELTEALRLASRRLSAVDRALGAMSDEERLVLDRFFVHRSKSSVDTICADLCIHKTRAYELRDKALHRFTLALYGVTET